jgi:hypothetical protein
LQVLETAIPGRDVGSFVQVDSQAGIDN